VARQTITACLIVKDEERDLPDALASVAFCDQVVVVDSGSTDRTVAIAEQSGAHVVHNPWPGFAIQRNVALDHATSEWVLELDADERVSDELRKEILAFLAAPPPDDVRMCVLPLTDHFLGRWLRPSTKYPKYRSRLFRRTAFRHDERREVHEGIDADERIWPMRGPLLHELARDLRGALADQRRYAELESRHIPAPGSAAELLKGAVVRPLAKLAVRTVVFAGWRDGWQGLVRIALEAGGDGAIFALAARHGGAPPGADDLGFGRARPEAGPVRIVAVARGAQDRSAAVAWLLAARAAGADVSLVTDARDVDAPWLPVHPIEGRGPLALVRALDAAAQARPLDAVAGTAADRRLLARLPGFARGWRPPLALEVEPVRAVAALRAVAR
jgi:hypothetical protein